MTLNAALVESARRGDEQALCDLLATYQVDMRRIARSQCASASDADDAVQESLWLVYRKIGALRTIAAFPGWVFSIIKRECHRLLHALRRSVKRPCLPTDSIPGGAMLQGTSIRCRACETASNDTRCGSI